MVIAPEPLPDEPLGTLSHDASGSAVHGQLACVVTDAITLLPVMHGLKSIGVTEYRHAETSPPCRTLNTLSATAIVVLRSAISVFRATVYDTVPLPLPWPAFTTTQDAPLTAVQAQSGGALTANVRRPPSSPHEEVSGVSS
jgi:hypothetical protein